MRSAKTFLGAAAVLLVALGALLGVRAALGDDDAADNKEEQVLRVVGDSFPEQAESQLLALAEADGIDAAVTAFGGASICSWWDQIEEYAAEKPDILVVAFAGNYLHPCITDNADQPREGDEVAGDYRADLETVLEMFEPLGTEIYVVLPPPVGKDVFEERAEPMREMYRQAHADHPDLTVIDSATHLDPDGQGFQPTLPCERWDDQDKCDADGQIQVRQDDLIHLTEAGGERYARAILEGIGFEPD